MRNAVTSLITAAVVVLVAPVSAATETVVGRIIDQGCYMKNKANTGLNHQMPAEVARCAEICAKEGRSLALLTRDRRIYTLAGELTANKNAKLVPHLGHVVRVTGEVVSEAGKLIITASTLTMEINEDS